jgi:lipid II:glycine glycyltransferase (peptidoglycan interpeptide bridge formation enzyme)
MSSLLQTKEWAGLRQSYGWKAYEIEGISVLQKELFLGKSFLYAPEVEWSAIKNIDKLLTKIKEIAQKNKTIFTRLEILDQNNEEIISNLKEKKFIKAFEEIQPEYRQIIDISKSEEEILSQMKEKGRYNTRVAQKRGVVIEKSHNLNEFYKIFCETAERDGFEIRPFKYFEDLMLKLRPINAVELLVAKYNLKTIAAEIVTYYQDTASYLYGASSNEDRNVMAPYLLHFEAMKQGKARGCKYYDLLAVNPEGKEDHKFAGIGRFKRQFGGRTINIVGSWDLIYQPFWYKLFKIAEQFRRH